MRFLIPLLFFFISCEAQVIIPAATQNDQNVNSEQMGQLWTESFSSLSDWTTTGAATFTPSAGDLSVSSSTGDYTSYITYNPWGNTIESFIISMTFVPTNKTTTSFGLGLGMRTANLNTTVNRSFFGVFNQTSGVNSGKCNVVRGSTQPAGVTTVATSSTGITWATNDVIRMDFQRKKNVYTVTVTNLSNSPTTNFRTVSFMEDATSLCNNSGYFAIWAPGGTATVQDVTVTSKAHKNIRAVFVGNSITHKSDATYLTRFPFMTFLNSTKMWEVNAGVGDYTGIYTDQLNNLKSFNADYVFICAMLGNDLEFGISSGTYQADYQNLRDDIVAAGAIPVHLLTFPRDAINMTTVNSWISSTFSGDLIIDTFTPLATGTALNNTYDSGDGVHPNEAGHALIATTIRTAMPYLY